MKDPVLAADGHTYERANIQEWFQRCHAGQAGEDTSPRSPITNQPLENSALIANHCVRGAINEALDAAQALHTANGVLANGMLAQSVPHTKDIGGSNDIAGTHQLKCNIHKSNPKTPCVTDIHAEPCAYACGQEEGAEHQRGGGGGQGKMTAKQAFALLRARKPRAQPVTQGVTAKKLTPEQGLQSCVLSHDNETTRVPSQDNQTRHVLLPSQDKPSQDNHTTHLLHSSPTLHVNGERQHLNESESVSEWSDTSCDRASDTSCNHGHARVQPRAQPSIAGSVGQEQRHLPPETSDDTDETSETSHPANEVPLLMARKAESLRHSTNLLFASSSKTSNCSHLDASPKQEQVQQLMARIYGDANAPTRKNIFGGGKSGVAALVAAGSALATNGTSAPTVSSAPPHHAHTVIQRGSRCWYSVGANTKPVTETGEMGRKQVEVEILSVDRSLQPPSYTILIDGHPRETEAHRLQLISNTSLLISNTSLLISNTSHLISNTTRAVSSTSINTCVSNICHDALASPAGASVGASEQSTRTTGASEQTKCTIGAVSTRSQATSQEAHGSQLQQEARDKDLMRRKRVLHAALERGTAQKRHKSLLDTDLALPVDMLKGYPHKAAILAMKRRDLEALANKYPAILPPTHTSADRLSSVALRSAALNLLEDKLQALLHPAAKPSCRPATHSSTAHQGAVGAASLCATSVGVEGAEGYTHQPAEQYTHKTCHNTWQSATTMHGEGASLFDMAQSAASSSTLGKRGRGALQSAWDLD